MGDDRLTDEWAACALGRSISHVEHVRIARVLVQRHGRVEARLRLVEGTRANCDSLNAADRFDEALTVLWSDRIADAIDERDADSFDAFLRLHPELANSDLLGPPAWKVDEPRPDELARRRRP